MSGGGGYYKYRCKNWLTHDCTNWVWVNGSTCSNCVALGRGNGLLPTSLLHLHTIHEIRIPRLYSGTLHYSVMAIVVNSTSRGWEFTEPLQAEWPLTRKRISAIDIVEVNNEENDSLLTGEELG